MKKMMKIALTVIVTLAIYAVFYFFLVESAAPENYAMIFGAFIVSVIGVIIGVPIGIATEWAIQKYRQEKNKIAIELAVAVIWGLLFGWLSLMGIMLGTYIMEKES
jgi:ABC-type phosphate transport system permease subunit